MSPHLHPTAGASRLESIDTLRGIAVLGILLMNIQLFAMIAPAYFNPTAYGDLGGINYAVWVFQHVFADQKFMTLFSMLFGAGMVLMADRAESRGVSATWLHYRRTWWLLVLGAMHAYLLWYGDILVMYAMSAAIVVWFRRRQPLTQFICGAVMLLIGTTIFAGAGLTLPQWPAEAIAEMRSQWAPTPEEISQETAAYRGGWLQQMSHRVPHSLGFHSGAFIAWGFWRAGGLMLIGMALFRWGFFSAVLDSARYRRFAAAGVVIGFPLVVYGLLQHEANQWRMEYSQFQGTLYNYWGSLAVSTAYLCLVMLWFQSGRLQALVHRFAAVGRMAFSNYIAQTLICFLLFYGTGLGLFGQAERWQQLLVVLGVWVLILLWSPWWLARFRYGPLEWLWRSLTYWELQRFRR
ncbi:MAG: DUF418 domain-containing protein [Xanthomonadales bacterium]|nr:DUF418 domain-containing protein [Xanthomonadales bacterium]